MLRLRVTANDGSRKHASWQIGTVLEYPRKSLAEKAAEALRMEANPAEPATPQVTMGGLIERYKLEKLPERYSTKSSYLSCLRTHIVPRWGTCGLAEMAAAPYEVERWLEKLQLAPKTKGHLKALMHRLFECAMKWSMFPLGRNPMELVEVKNVTRRTRLPRVLTYDEFWLLLEHIPEPFRLMVLTAQCLGLRVSEVMALKWSDFDFDNLVLRVERGIVQGRVDEVKTEYSQDDLPLDPDFATMMLGWKLRCPSTPEDWVFANPNTQKPYWQDAIVDRRIRPAAVKAGLGSNIGWHNFRHTYRNWLDAGGANVSVQRELMRHASIQTTMNVYGRATMSEAKRQANSKVVQVALRPWLVGQK